MCSHQRKQFLIIHTKSKNIFLLLGTESHIGAFGFSGFIWTECSSLTNRFSTVILCGNHCQNKRYISEEIAAFGKSCPSKINWKTNSCDNNYLFRINNFICRKKYTFRIKNDILRRIPHLSDPSMGSLISSGVCLVLSCLSWHRIFVCCLHNHPLYSVPSSSHPSHMPLANVPLFYSPSEMFGRCRHEIAELLWNV